MGGSLPTYTTTFIGRESDLSELTDLLESGQRLVTITGPAGMGKTRLVCALAEQLDSERDVRFIDLSEAHDETAICSAVAEALDHVLAGDGDLVDDLASAVKALGEAVLVLDNLEQVAEAAAAPIGTWIEKALGVTFVATSREPLRLAPEREFRLSPLSTSGPGDRPAPAVLLFRDRAERVRRGFPSDAQSQQILEELTNRLDGVPLAIELVASKSHLLAPAQLLEMLDEQFSYLTGKGSTSTGRHDTLHNAIDFSWQLLSDGEKSALAQASIFRGAFDTRRFLDVISVAHLPEAPPLMELLDGLISKSLVLAFTQDNEQAFRYRLLIDVRVFVAGFLDGQVREECESRFVAHMAGTVDQLPGVVLPSTELLRALQYDRDNLTVCLNLALKRADSVFGIEKAAQLAMLLCEVYARFGPLSSAEAVLERVLGRSGPIPLPKEFRAHLLLHRSGLRRIHRDLDSAESDARGALAAAEEVGSERLTTMVCVSLAVLLLQRFQHEEARQLLSRVPDSQMAREAGVHAWCHYALATSYLDCGRVPESIHECDLAIESATEYEHSLTVSQAAIRRASCALETGDYLNAVIWFERARLDPNSQSARATACHGLGRTFQLQGQLEEAEKYYAESLEQFEEVGNKPGKAIVSAYWGWLHAANDEIAESQKLLSQAETLLRRMGLTELVVGVQTFAGHLDLAKARTSTGALQLALLQSAHHRLQVTNGSEPAEAEELRDWESMSFFVRFAATTLRQALERQERGGDTQPDAVFGAKGTWFELTGQDRCNIHHRATLCRVLECLLTARTSQPGLAVNPVDLFAAGWPDENVSIESGMNRVYVAISTLRKLGLSGQILKREGGYLIDPDSVVRVQDE